MRPHYTEPATDLYWFGVGVATEKGLCLLGHAAHGVEAVGAEGVRLHQSLPQKELAKARETLGGRGGIAYPLLAKRQENKPDTAAGVLMAVALVKEGSTGADGKGKERLPEMADDTVEGEQARQHDNAAEERASESDTAEEEQASESDTAEEQVSESDTAEEEPANERDNAAVEQVSVRDTAGEAQAILRETLADILLNVEEPATQRDTGKDPVLEAAGMAHDSSN
ncbi:Cytokinesis protein cyk3 [Neofusicoccum parvum]|uniref:Cytokinesis protein cyk3 n=1 Tax=Neofusicoccum parvum TaxID=310453 RepID=A0ACB5SBG1_9PEZI|nr:Cytokinesis protein cyk3 [Neofusicoccum parvum]